VGDAIGSRCNARGTYACPVESCLAYACKNHVEETRHSGVVRVVPLRSPRGLDGMMAQRNEQGDHEDSEENNVSHV